MSEQRYSCTEILDFEEVDVLTRANHMISTDVTLADSASSASVLSGTGQREHSVKGGNSKATQTSGHVFLGKRGEVIITSDYTLIKLVINSEAVQELTNPTVAGVDYITDVIMKSLARLEWNGERILHKAMTSFRLTLTHDLMPRLLREVGELMLKETEQHRVQILAQQLLEQHLVKLFGVDVSSLVFILEHSSVDDASLTLESSPRQRQLQRIFMTFLPDWVAPRAQWTVTAYTLTAEDLAQDFGFSQRREVCFADSVLQQGEESGGGGVQREEEEDVEVMESSSDSKTGEIGEASTSREEPKAFTSREEPKAFTSREEPKASTSREEPKASSSREEPKASTSQMEEEVQGGGTFTAGAGLETLTGVSARGLLRLEDVDTDSIPEQDVDLRLVIVGKTGCGKSSTANTIVGRPLFPEAASFSSVTTDCLLHTATRDGITIEILDSPGLFDTTLSTQEVSSMVLSAVSRMEEGPDALLYVLKIGGRYTEEEFAVYTLLKALLDENVTRYVIVVFTHGDALQGRDIGGLLTKPESLVTMIRECDNRYVVFDNTASNKTPQVNQLLALVRQVQEQNQGRRYRCPRYAEKLDEIDLELEVRLIKAEKERLKGRTYIQTLQARLHQTEQQLKREAEQFAQQEQAAKEALRKREASMTRQIAQLTEALQREQLEEAERQKQILDLQQRQAKEGEQSRREVERLRQQQLAEENKRMEELQRQIEKLRAEREEAERAVVARQAQEMMAIRRDVARSRRRKDKDCRIM